MISLDRLSRQSRFCRYFAVGICSVPLAVIWLQAKGVNPISISCPIRHYTGSICPSCGMTRSLVAIASGDWRSAIDYHLFGLLLSIGGGLTLVRFSWELVIDRRIQIVEIKWLKSINFPLTILPSFLGYYLLRLHQIIPHHL